MESQTAQVEFLDHTADIGLRVLAASPAATFAAMAEAMFGIIVNRDTVQPSRTWEQSVEADGWDNLLVAWLEELLYRYESEELLVRTVQIREIDPHHLVADLIGDHLDLRQHETGVQIKAVTYHQLRAEETDQGFVAQVIFDI